ncbi:MAG: type II toxin-antitoxin system Phd/YefM family antitoxin [Desulfobacteraceae bacterium]
MPVKSWSCSGTPFLRIIKTAFPSWPGISCQVIDDADYTIITRRDSEDAVVMSLETFNSFMETVYLLRSPANAAHLTKSIDQFRNGKVQERDLIDE